MHKRRKQHLPLNSGPLLAKKQLKRQETTNYSWHNQYTAPNCIVVLADIVKSRQLQEQRNAIQIQLRQLIQSLNDRAAGTVISAFEIREGDGIRGVLSSGESIADLLWQIDTELSGVRMRAGVGRGGLSTFGKFPDDLDGPAYYAARDAIALAARQKLLGGVFLGFAEYDDVMTALAYSLADRRRDFTERQCRVVRLLLSGHSKSEVAKEMRITASSVHDITKAAHWAAYSREHISLVSLLSTFESVDAWTSELAGSSK